MKKIIVGIVLFILGAGASKAHAHPAGTPCINREQIRQQGRIYTGIRSGELTRREAFGLEMREARIQHDKRMARADGRVTPFERRRLHREKCRASRAIYFDKHNLRVR